MNEDRWSDKLAIREVLENWVIFSDSGLWEEFKAVWNPGADMSATWTVADADTFMRRRREGWENGVSILHFLGGTNIQLVGERAVTQTKMTISQRATVHDVLVDVLCTGRFYDFFEKVDGRWAISRRRVIYEKDRMDPVVTGSVVPLDETLLDSFPEGYKYLAYLQTQIGYDVKGPARAGMKGDAVQQLYAQGRAWLDGDSLPPGEG